MVPMRKSAGFVAVVLAAGVVGSVSMVKNVEADDGCRPVFGHYQAQFTTTNCTAPSGLCATGTITEGGILDSSSLFIELDQAPSAGMPLTEPSATVSYSGTLTITTPHDGTLNVRDLGVVAGANNAFTELERPVSGTGRFEHASNVFFISGSTTGGGTGFDGRIHGELCGVPDHFFFIQW
jgi:hypothetical protein